MTKLLTFLLLSFPPLANAQSDIPLVSTTKPEGINFVRGLSWEQIKEKAKAENKYIFLDCYTTWCGYCKQMDQRVYPELHVGYEYNEHFISAKVQMDSSS